jgi:hypothetical protein
MLMFRFLVAKSFTLIDASALKPEREMGAAVTRSGARSAV